MTDPVNQPEPRGSSLPYFAYAGWVVGIVVLVTHIERARLGDLGWSFVWQLIALALATLFLVATKLLPANPRWLTPFWNWRFNFGAHVDDNPVLTIQTRPLSSIFNPFVPYVAATKRLLHARYRIRLSFSERRALHIYTWPLSSILARAAAAIFILAGLGVLIADHRRYVVIIALLQVAAFYALRPQLPRSRFISLAILSITSWSLIAGLTYTHLADWLMNGAPSSGLAALAFVLAFGLVVVEFLRQSRAVANPRNNLLLFGAAILIFAAFALRTDNFLVDWVPIHRSYFADISQLVRDGHWLLWDVPSLYGFLSMLTLAVIPAKDGWQAVYELTAIFLTAQAAMTFVMLRWGRSGWVNGAFAILFPLSTLFGESLARYAWGGRLYPQGGLRFLWIECLIFVAFMMYVRRDDERMVSRLRWAGTAVWCIAAIWSIENFVWATAVWFPFLIADAIVSPAPAGFIVAIRRFVSRAWPLVAFPVAFAVLVELVYRIRLGVGPDWRSYVEFTGLFSSGSIRPIFHVQNTGAGWTILIVLCAVGALGLDAVRKRKWEVVPVIAATWLAVWSTATYFALEPLDPYVTLLLAVLVPAAAVILFISRENGLDDATGFFARLSLAPLAIIAIAVLLGEPSRIAAMQFPFSPGYNADIIQGFPPISGELAELISRAGIQPGDEVLVPNGAFWTELDQGMIQPFVRDADGKIREYHSWLPMSPVAAQMLYNGLPRDRQKIYIERFLAKSHSGGWYIAYRDPANCSALSPHLRTARHTESLNFSASLCTYEP